MMPRRKSVARRKPAVAVLILSTILSAILLGQTPIPSASTPSSLERDFVAGGKVIMKLASGDYTIRSGSEDKIRIQWETRKPEQLKSVTADVQIRGAEATIQTKAPKKSHLRAVVELPERSDIHVRLSSGDLSIRGIDGDKDVECHAGDITVSVGSPADYSRVDASSRAGDIEAPPFGASKGGFFRSFQWQGKGKYALHAHVGTGSITLLGPSRE